ncbi:hypothetical protein [Deinococcus sp. JMULE3]|uniref:hypothetical protein n=1 Tax=Deinococcus sp. JMULE3 TaxID=2518341 RepID=UPI001574FB9C|nr:hypothetical protein [Deinococcus sp. JMULE3]NTY01653.1 hypothetical protein [Deinococcus sp. JMULE3]
MLPGVLFLAGVLLFILSAALGGDGFSRAPGLLGVLAFLASAAAGLSGLNRAVGAAALLFAGLAAALVFGWL